MRKKRISTRPGAEAAARAAALNQVAVGGTAVEEEKMEDKKLPGAHSEVKRPDARRTQVRQAAGNRFRTVHS